MIRLLKYNKSSHYLDMQRKFVTNASTTHIKIRRANLIAPAYQPVDIEKAKYELWEKQNLFRPATDSSKPKFSMILPPPNVTGKLHLGHALACTVQDVIARYKRSTGHNVLWLPGTDHAGIATQSIVERFLTKKGTDRQDIGRDAFINEVWKWKEKHGNTICNQLRTLGCSLDWSRQVFTMDPMHTHAVNTAFLQLYKKGLIYRKKALVNWCNSLQSTVSDIEVDAVEISGPTDIQIPGYDKPVRFGQLYNFAYKLYDSNDEIVVSTTTPETMLGDTAIAVHPEDPRYKHLKGKKVIHPFRKTQIPIIYDRFVDMKFGTGAVKLTPSHSKIDYNLAKHHNLPMFEVIDEKGLIINVDEYKDMKRYNCRRSLVKRLNDIGLLRGIVPHKMSLPICSRTGNVIDHLPKEQWFLSCKVLNKKVAEFVKSGKLKVLPEKFIKTWLDWTEDDRDWCISRQLWWGHQIPAYKCTIDKNVVWIAATDESSARIEASKFLRCLPDMVRAERDSDVLDTWFSSAIYPFAALGWPNCHQSRDFGQFYPLSLMVTGHDILGFWVHRMAMLGLELTDKLPFNEVLLHGIICDNKGAKMSKSRGNVIDPIDVVNGISLEDLKTKSKTLHENGLLSKNELKKALAYHKENFSQINGIPECGVDALRFTLLTQDIKSHFVNFDVAMCHANKLFCNKIWQSINYTRLCYGKLIKIDDNVTVDDLTSFDKWILSRLANMVGTVKTSMDNNDYHLATRAIKTLLHKEFCDVYLEATKPGFDHPNPKVGYAHAHTLSVVLNTALRCLAPFMVFLTEELIPRIPAFDTSIIHNYYDEDSEYLEFPNPDSFETWKNVVTEERVGEVLSAINLVRELKGLYNVSHKLRPCVYVNTKDEILISDVSENKVVVLNLTRCSDLRFEDAPTENIIKSTLGNNTEIIIQLTGDEANKAIINAKEKIEKRISKIRVLLSNLEQKYSSDNYLATVPPEIQALDKEKFELKKKELDNLRRLI